uniref:Allatostatin CC n=1 Tax=Graphocephala atropunctata TaxID=36148 RepID=A0A1B6LKC5_9HEMI
MGEEPRMGPPPPLQQLLCMLSLLLSASVTAMPSSGKPLQPLTLMKKSAAAISADYPDYQVGVKYDEYPVVVPKRAAVLLDRIMVALQKAVDEDTLGPRKMDLERRGRKEGGRVYWRCYFNAVTCF